MARRHSYGRNFKQTCGNTATADFLNDSHRSILIQKIKNLMLTLENLKVIARQQHLHIKINFTE
jgi:hypothetical protein